VAEVVRTPFAPETRLRTRRSLDERFFVRWPASWAAFGRLGLLLPPRSRLRRTLLRRSALSSLSAFARSDLDLHVARYALDYEVAVPPEFASVGLHSSYHGHAGLRELIAAIRDSYEEANITPKEIVDAGNRLVVLGNIHIRGRRSGVELDSPFGQAVWIERGLIVRERWFLDRDAALSAANIPTATAGSASPRSRQDNRIAQH
jgi:ketosteroid isomerase-like protein